MRTSGLKILVGISLLGGTIASADETLVGELRGDAVVNNMGTLSYAIPLNVSPGTAGMEPKLGISYTSRGGNGALGVGFSLSGLSSITRGGASIDQDGFIDGVDFDDNDRFLLDGQRLEIVATNGTPTTNKIYYGTDDSEYRTEIDSFSRVIAHGQAGNGPAWFEVWTKAGLRYEYGHTTDSAFKPATNNASVLSWSVSRITDPAGNYMTFTYTTNSAGPQISRIDYTGNEGASLSAYNSVDFVYTTNRTDTSQRFFMGTEMFEDRRLEKIVMSCNSNHVHDYRFEYTYSEAGQSLLVDPHPTAPSGSGLCSTPASISTRRSVGWGSTSRRARPAPPVPSPKAGRTRIL